MDKNKSIFLANIKLKQNTFTYSFNELGIYDPVLFESFEHSLRTIIEKESKDLRKLIRENHWNVFQSYRATSRSMIYHLDKTDGFMITLPNDKDVDHEELMGVFKTIDFLYYMLLHKSEGNLCNEE